MALVRREPTEWPDLFRRFFNTDWDQAWMRVEEYRDGDSLVLRAELPGIDPDNDIEVSVADGVLHIDARRDEKFEQKEKHGYRSEFRYGRFTRSFILPAGVTEESVTANYADGVLEMRFPVAQAPKESVTRVPITKS